MKGPILLVAAVAASCSSASTAATFVQFDSEAQQRGFTGFDSTQGTLNKVTLGVEITKSRVWQLNMPADQLNANYGVSWSVNGKWVLGSSIASLDGREIAITGSGKDLVRLNRSSNDGDRAFGYFDVAATGNALLDLDPTLFVNTPSIFNGFDPGFFSNVEDTTFQRVPVGSNRFQLAGACFVDAGGNPSGNEEDLCGGVRYTLTYDYTPAVPEPATWGLMLAGFAVTGAALRRRRTASVA